MTPRKEKVIPTGRRLEENRWKTGYPLPRGNEAQCPRCSLIFANDYTCERHKFWPVGGQPLECVDPRDMGLVVRVKANREVWLSPEAAVQHERQAAVLEKARDARRAKTDPGDSVGGSETPGGAG